MIRNIGNLKPIVGKGSIISPGAYVAGDVEIGEGVEIFDGAIIRGDSGKITIGNSCWIQEGSIIRGFLGNGVSIGQEDNIGHGVVIQCTKVGNNSLLANNCTIDGNVEIGNFSVIGANAKIEAGMQIPDWVLVFGNPAKIARNIKDDERWKNELISGMKLQDGFENLHEMWKALGMYS